VSFTRGVRVEDRRTGLRLELGADASVVLDALEAGRALPGVPEVDGFLNGLQSLGLLDDGAPVPSVQTRQGAFLLDQAFEAQLPQLVASLEHAAKSSAFHRAHLAGCNLAVNSPADLEKLPLMFKQDLRANLSALIADGVNVPGLMESGDLTFSATSGTTGERLQVISDTRLAALPPGHEALWGLPARPDDTLPRTAVFTSPVCTGPVCHLGKASMAERTCAGNTLFLNSTDDIFAITRPLAENIVAELQQFRPDFIVANPVYLCVLAERAAAWNLQIPPPAAIISTYQFLSRCQRRILRRNFDCPVFDFLAATDLGGSKVAVECLHGARHLRLDHAVTEVVRNGRRAAPG